MTTIEDAGVDAVKVAEAAYQDAVKEADTLRRRVIDGDTNVSGADLAEADAAIELAELRFRAAEEVRDRALQERYEADRKAFVKRVEALRKRRDGKVAELADGVRQAALAFIAEAADYGRDRAEVAGQADYYQVTDLPGTVRPVKAILTHVGEALAAHPQANRTGLASDVRNMAYGLQD